MRNLTNEELSTSEEDEITSLEQLAWLRTADAAMMPEIPLSYPIRQGLVLPRVWTACFHVGKAAQEYR